MPTKRKGFFSCFGRKGDAAEDKDSEALPADGSEQVAQAGSSVPGPKTSPLSPDNATTVMAVSSRAPGQQKEERHEPGVTVVAPFNEANKPVDQKKWVQEYAAKQEAEQAGRASPGGKVTKERQSSARNRGGGGGSSSTQEGGKQAKGTSGVSDAMTRMVSRSKNDAYVTFQRYDSNKDGFLTRQDLYEGLKELNLGLTPEMYRQYIDCNFMYADMDNDGKLSLDEYSIIHGMINEVRRKFARSDKDGDGLIDKKNFTQIVKELHLNLNDEMCAHYVDINFRYVDRNFRGTITFGQFLACYANFLISHALMHPKLEEDRPQTAAPPQELEPVQEFKSFNGGGGVQGDVLGGGAGGGRHGMAGGERNGMHQQPQGYSNTPPMQGARKPVGGGGVQTMIIDDLEDEDVETIFVNGPL